MTAIAIQIVFGFGLAGVLLIVHRALQVAQEQRTVDQLEKQYAIEDT